MDKICNVTEKTTKSGFHFSPFVEARKWSSKNSTVFTKSTSYCSQIKYVYYYSFMKAHTESSAKNCSQTNETNGCAGTTPTSVPKPAIYGENLFFFHDLGIAIW